MSSVVDKIEKAPRWFLIIVLLVLWTAVDKGGTYIFHQFAGEAAATEIEIKAIKAANEAAIDAIKPVIYQAKANAEKAIEIGADLKVQVEKVQVTIEKNRVEYRDDRIRDQANLKDDMKEMEVRIIRAVKS